MIAVIGSSQISSELYSLAQEVGKKIIDAGYHLLCGGLGGVMEAAARGARESKKHEYGKIIGILPSISKEEANPYIDTVIPTGLGFARNVIVVLASDAVVAINGGVGTLSEMAYAWVYGKPIIGLTSSEGWAAELAGRALDNKRTDTIIPAKTPDAAIDELNKIFG